MLSRWWSSLQALWRRDDWERNLEDELRLHVEQRAADLRRGGFSAAEADRRARLELGPRETFREECRRSFGLRWFDELRQDVAYLLRTTRKSPGFPIIAVLSLALGIGANTVVFSALNALVLRPLPIESPEQVYFVQGSRFPSHSFPNYRAFRDRNQTFSGLIAYRVEQIGMETHDGPRRLWCYLASGNYFDTLGVKPAIGRFFHAEDDVTPGGSPYAVLNYDTWQSRFAGDPAIVGKTIHINALPYTVLGVAPRGFIGTEMLFRPDVWVPFMMQPVIDGRSWLDDRSMFNTWVAGRLRAGVTPQQATANLQSVAEQIMHDFPAENFRLKMKLTRPGLVDDNMRGNVSGFLAGIMALAALVLLAACANLASLLAARTTDRHFEIALRLSIGAGRGRILRQLVTESLCIALVGGAAGVGVAFGTLRAMARVTTPIDFFRLDFAPDSRVLLFALAVSLLTGIIFGVAPARRAVRTDPNGALREKRAGRVSRDFLLLAQVALCCLLVTTCFVSLRSLSRAFKTPLGFEADGLNAAAFDLQLAGYSREQAAAFQRRALDAVSQLPGAVSASYGNSVPVWIDQSHSGVLPETEAELTNAHTISAVHYVIAPGYFQTMGTRLLAGRDFTWHDDAKAPLVGIVNQSFARLVLNTADPIGRHYRVGQSPLIEVVGLVEDGKYESLTEMSTPAFFHPIVRSPNTTTVLLLRSRLPESEASAQLRQAIAALDPQLPVYGLGGIRQMLGMAYFPARTATAALTAFGLLALMLAVTGIYGLAAYTVSRRVHEIGVRVAIGARPSQVLRSVMGRTGGLLLTGCCAGLLMGLASTRLLASVVFQATPRDPLVIAAVGATMVLVALGATWMPARRAVSVDPIRSLRHE